jgi:diguanylate cyclase (GGDEF)-like protein
MLEDSESQATAEHQRLLPWSSLLLGRRIDPLQRSFHERLLRRRVSLLAGVLALLMLVWIPLDAAGLPGDEFLAVLLIRLVLCAGLLGIALRLRRPGPMRWTLAALGIVLMGQCLAFCAMQSALSPGTPAILVLGYELFPFVLLAQLALFPLPALHTLLLGAALLGARAMALLSMGRGTQLEFIGDLWLMALLLAISIWAAAAQFSLLLNLLSARRDAAHDALTGLANRRAALDRLTSEVARARRSGNPLSVLMLDLDRFKSVNDTWGHAVGDMVLVETAGILRSELRGEDLGVRFGGEEFLAILSGTDVEAARHVAERIRRRTAESRVCANDNDVIHITISIGVAMFDGREDAASLIARADAALYRAKERGRDRVELAGTGHEDESGHADLTVPKAAVSLPVEAGQ